MLIGASAVDDKLNGGRQDSKAANLRHGRIPVYCNLADGPSTSRSEALTVAVGFSPRFRPIRGSRVAERRWNDGESSNLRAVHSSLRDSCLTTILHRGLKPTATVMKSLRDCGAALSEAVATRLQETEIRPPAGGTGRF